MRCKAIKWVWPPVLVPAIDLRDGQENCLAIFFLWPAFPWSSVTSEPKAKVGQLKCPPNARRLTPSASQSLQAHACPFGAAMASSCVAGQQPSLYETQMRLRWHFTALWSRLASLVLLKRFKGPVFLENPIPSERSGPSIFLRSVAGVPINMLFKVGGG